MSRTLLVYPRFPETFWGYQRALRLLGLRATHPPLGLLTVAGMLPKDTELRLVDLNRETLDAEHLRWAEIVLTGGMRIQRPSVQGVVDRCVAERVPVVIGGPDATSSCHELPAEAHIVLGEAESPRLADALRGMVDCRERVVLDLRQESLGIDESPLPRYDIVDIHNYASMALQMSRGCPFKCEFCDIPFLFGNRTRYKSVDRALAELDLLYQRGWRGTVFWVDDNFIGNKRSCKDILPHVVDWQRRHGMPFQFYTQASINLAGDPDLLDLMRAAGFDNVFIGIETPVEESLLETRKLQNMRFNLLDSVKTLQRAGMEVMAGFIIGFDNDPTDIDAHLIRFIQDSGIPVAMTGLLTAIPGSPLYDRFKAEGRLLESAAEHEGNNTFEFAFNFKTAREPENLIRAYKNVLMEVYGKPENYFDRVLELYRRLGRQPVSTPPLSRRRVAAMIRSLLMIPTSSYGRSYAKFLFRTLRRHPSRFLDAFRKGIVGLHFYQLTHERLAVDEFSSFVSAAVERVREAYARGRHEGGKLAAQVLADGQEEIKNLPLQVRREARKLYEDLENTLAAIAASLEPAPITTS